LESKTVKYKNLKKKLKK